MKCIQYSRINYKAFAHIQTVKKHVAFTYRRMPLQHPVTGPAAQVPDPDRLILITTTGGQATVRQRDQGGY